jgi:hypothetical protein
MCDGDAITVDLEMNSGLGLGQNKYSQFRKNNTDVNKSNWDYIVFSSGFRNNYWNGGQVDMGGSGTYDNGNSKSRINGYTATYGYANLSNVCSGYSIKLWNAYKPSWNTIYNKNNPTYNSYSRPHDLYYAIISGGF